MLPLSDLRVLIVVENLPVPLDRRVWQEARTLTTAGAEVSVICPAGKGYESRHEVLEGINIYRHSLPLEAAGVLGYFAEYGSALFWETVLAWRIHFTRGIDIIHGCNPPDLIFLVALPFKVLGKRFLFDHHDLSPELYEAKFGKRNVLWRLLLFFERLSFALASVSIATNESYRNIAITRGRMKPEDVFVVRSGPDLSRTKALPTNLKWKNGREYLVGYVGVMGSQEGIDLLLKTVRHLVHERKRHDIHFVLIGGGPSFDSLVKMSSEMGLSKYVTFTGRASDDELFEILSTADVCVNPDRVNAMNDLSTMNKIMDYMALAKPIVQYNVREGRYSAQNASLYAKPNDPIDFAEKIEALLVDAGARARMGAQGRRRVEQELSWGNSIEPLIAAYRRSLEK